MIPFSVLLGMSIAVNILIVILGLSLGFAFIWTVPGALKVAYDGQFPIIVRLTIGIIYGLAIVIGIMFVILLLTGTITII